MANGNLFAISRLKYCPVLTRVNVVRANSAAACGVFNLTLSVIVVCSSLNNRPSCSAGGGKY